MENGIVLPEAAPVASKLFIEFHSPFSAEFKIAIEGTLSPAQKYVAAGWLASLDARDFVFTAGEPLATESTLILDFGAPGSSVFTPRVRGRVSREQLWSAAGWVRWAADFDFTVAASRAAYQAQQQQAANQQVLAGLARGRVH